MVRAVVCRRPAGKKTPRRAASSAHIPSPDRYRPQEGYSHRSRLEPSSPPDCIIIVTALRLPAVSRASPHTFACLCLPRPSRLPATYQITPTTLTTQLHYYLSCCQHHVFDSFQPSSFAELAWRHPIRWRLLLVEEEFRKAAIDDTAAVFPHIPHIHTSALPRSKTLTA